MNTVLQLKNGFVAMVMMKLGEHRGTGLERIAKYILADAAKDGALVDGKKLENIPTDFCNDHFFFSHFYEAHQGSLNRGRGDVP